MSETVIDLNRGDSLCTIAPGIGGSIAGWSVGGQAMLRPASNAGLTDADPLAMASFPLVPFSNRIGHAMFTWAGVQHRLALNFPPEPHAIHGVGWQRQWNVDQRTGDMLRLSLCHSGDEHWPWPFVAQQTFHLTERNLTLQLRAFNHAAIAVPLGFGHHPYFDVEGASLRFDAANMWLSGEDGLPTQCVKPLHDFDFRCGSQVAGRAIDNCYGGVSGTTEISWRQREFKLSIASTLAYAVLYIPDGGDAFCFEPVANLSNALHIDDKHTPVIAPGACFEATIIFEASKL